MNDLTQDEIRILMEGLDALRAVLLDEIRDLERSRSMERRASVVSEVEDAKRLQDRLRSTFLERLQPTMK